MPSRNVVKEFGADSMYHVYNRGVDKRIIFTDQRDYAVFLSFLKYALLSDAEHQKKDEVDTTLLTDAQRFNLRREGLADKVDLVSFCLMPNHFHLLLYQYEPDAITKLMRSIATGYAIYFNKRHERTGSLFQGVYKASRINSDAYWWHVSRYIHLNPPDIGEDYKTYPYSSYRFYVKQAEADWVKPKLIMDGFKGKKDYEKFVSEYLTKRNELLEIKDVLANSKELTVQG
ncbi:MAG: transposase [Candidatus Saccharibacteria bacterium]|nr:transposase [Candidatus Saccharibacteria bacterium]